MAKEGYDYLEDLAKYELEAAGRLAAELILRPLAAHMERQAAVEFGGSGVFLQERIGQADEHFVIAKTQTMPFVAGAQDQRFGTVSPYATERSQQWRKQRRDEASNWINIALGQMWVTSSHRPEVPEDTERIHALKKGRHAGLASEILDARYRFPPGLLTESAMFRASLEDSRSEDAFIRSLEIERQWLRSVTLRQDMWNIATAVQRLKRTNRALVARAPSGQSTEPVVTDLLGGEA